MKNSHRKATFREADDVLAAVEKLSNAAWHISYSLRVDSMTNFQHSQAEGNDLVVNDLVRDAAKFTPAEIQRIQQKLKLWYKMIRMSEF